VIDKVDEIVLVDGRIDAFPGEGYKSTDRTVMIAESYGCTVIKPSRAWKNEAEMRSQYLVGNDGDWYVLIDADERCVTELPDIADFPTGVNAYAVNVRMIGAPVSVWRPRIIKHVGIMEYREIHDALFSNGELVSRPQDVAKLHNVWFAHYQMARSQERRDQKQQYYRNGYAHEADYRREWEMFNNG
jgi:hypothetical protein